MNIILPQYKKPHYKNFISLLIVSLFCLPTWVVAEIQATATIGSDVSSLDIFSKFQSSAPPALEIGPIKGWTKTKNIAPAKTDIPRGTRLMFYQPASQDSQVLWNGANEQARDEKTSSAECTLDKLGQTEVSVTVTDSKGIQFTNTSVLNVVDLDPADVKIRELKVHANPLRLRDSSGQSLNEKTMEYYFSDESIAALSREGGRYITSLNRTVHLSAEIEPAGIRPLIEWRVNHQDLDSSEGLSSLGSKFSYTFTEIGQNTIQVGPLASKRHIKFEIYSTFITSHLFGLPKVKDGQSVNFSAVTFPAGYEDRIQWLASTLFGGSNPVVGTGPNFTVRFDQTWGESEEGVEWSWLGVKADNVVFNQDEKEGACCANCNELAVCFEQLEDDCDFFFLGAGISCTRLVCQAQVTCLIDNPQKPIPAVLNFDRIICPDNQDCCDQVEQDVEDACEELGTVQGDVTCLCEGPCASSFCG